MKRRALFILLLLVAGAIVNVAVAWGCVLLLPPILSTHQRMADEENHALLRALFRVEGVNANETYGASRKRCGWRSVSVTGSLNSPTHFLDIDGKEAGWPLLALYGFVTWEDGTIEQRRFRAAIEVPPSMESKRPDRGMIDFLPLRPIWPGFAINTVFYAFILWGLFAAPFALRRLRGARRLKRGLCPKCAYPVGTNQVCTECGAAVTNRRCSV